MCAGRWKSLAADDAMALATSRQRHPNRSINKKGDSDSEGGTGGGTSKPDRREFVIVEEDLADCVRSNFCALKGVVPLCNFRFRVQVR